MWAIYYSFASKPKNNKPCPIQIKSKTKAPTLGERAGRMPSLAQGWSRTLLHLWSHSSTDGCGQALLKAAPSLPTCVHESCLTTKPHSVFLAPLAYLSVGLLAVGHWQEPLTKVSECCLPWMVPGQFYTPCLRILPSPSSLCLKHPLVEQLSWLAPCWEISKCWKSPVLTS